MLQIDLIACDDLKPVTIWTWAKKKKKKSENPNELVGMAKSFYDPTDCMHGLRI